MNCLVVVLFFVLAVTGWVASCQQVCGSGDESAASARTTAESVASDAIALGFAERALDEYVGKQQSDVIDKISARLSLSLAMCLMKECSSSIPLLKDGMAIAKVRCVTVSLGDKRTVVRVPRCWELFASATLLERAVREKYL